MILRCQEDFNFHNDYFLSLLIKQIDRVEGEAILLSNVKVQHELILRA